MFLGGLMSKIGIFSFIYSLFKKQIKNIYNYYLSINRIDICKVSYKNNQCKYTINNITGYFPFDERVLESIRLECGNNILMKYGLPLKDQTVPVIYLYTDITFFQKNIETFGIKKTLKLIRNWVGSSESNGITVCKYKVLGPIE